MSRQLLLVLCVVAGACVKPDATVHCGEFTCGDNSVCSPAGDRCVAAASVDACQTLAEGDVCSYVGLVGTGVCQTGVCVFGGCGNHIVETASDEVCDDGNNISGDGCRADCKSLEVCGDGVIDVAVGELCDCGTDPAQLPADCNGINSDTGGATCRADCKGRSRCGDGIIDPGEICDDGNNVPGDGCRADCQGRWTRMDTPFLAQLRSVWATSATDVWAVGVNHILHYDGAQWADIPRPGGAVTATYTRVWGISSQDVFVIVAGAPNAVWRRFNGTWSNVTPSTGYTWVAMQGSGANLWISGHLGNGVATAAHWNGASFDLENDVGGVQQAAGNTAFDVAVASDGTTYINGDNDSVYRRNAMDNWSYVTQATYLVAISSSDATGFREPTGASHYNGSIWTPIPDTANVLNVKSVHGVAGSTLAVGGGGHVLACTATQCKPSSTGVVDDLNDVFVFDANRAFIVGDFGTVLY